MKNDARDAVKKVRKLLDNKNISSYWIAKQTGLSNSQLNKMRKMDDLGKVRIETFIKIIDYMNAVEKDKFRTK